MIGSSVVGFFQFDLWSARGGHKSPGNLVANASSVSAGGQVAPQPEDRIWGFIVVAGRRDSNCAFGPGEFALQFERPHEKRLLGSCIQIDFRCIGDEGIRVISGACN